MVRRWVTLGLVVLAVSACGGNVVVDHGGNGGSGDGGSGAGNGNGGGDVCQQAVHHVSNCAAAGIPTPPSGACTGITACVSGCLLETSCPALTGADPSGLQTFRTCLAGCGL